MAPRKRAKKVELILESAEEVVDLKEEEEPVVRDPDFPWDDPNTVKRVDAYWTGSVDEKKHRANIAALIRRFMMTPRDSLLEIGSGTGLIYEALKESGDIRYLGLDRSKAMLELASKRYRDADFREGDALRLPFPDRSYDLPFAFEVFGHMADCEQAIGELYRVARKVTMFSVWLGNVSEAVRGSDHYEYPNALIQTYIRTAARNDKIVVSTHDIGWSTAFVVQKV